MSQGAGRAIGNGGRSLSRDDGGEQPIELRRHLDALRRARWPIVAFVVLVTAAAVGISLALPKTYEATARILYNATQDPLAATDAASVERQLATIGSLITTPAVLGQAAPDVGLTEAELEKKVAASVDSTANILDVSATAGSAAAAQQIANTVTRTFLARQRGADIQRIEAARARLGDELARLGGVPGSAQEAQAIRARLSELTVSQASAGSELQLAEPAQRPTSPASPRPVRNGVVAFFAALFLAALVALGRDQLVPRVSGPRELTRITDRPVLVSIPFVRRRFGTQPRVLGAAEHEAYQTLQASLRFQLPSRSQHIILVTSALEGEGKTTVTANLGQALARAGRKALVVSADMRKPKLHTLFDVEQEPGLSEVLTALDGDGEGTQARTIAALRALLRSQAEVKGNLHVLASGKKPDEPARLLLSNGLVRLFEQLREMEYEYVLVDGTPLLGLADSQSLVQRCDEVLVVTRLDTARVEDVVEVRDVLDRLDVTPLGHVVIGGRRLSTAASYYAATSELETL